jgi:hypothetical protein
MWLDRSLFQGPRLALVTSEKQFLAAKKAAGVACDDPLLEGSWHACTHTYQGENNQLVCIVGISLAACETMCGIEVAALLTHEAVHVWQHVRDRLGPGDLGREMEAYAVQNIAANLMRAFASITSF